MRLKWFDLEMTPGIVVAIAVYKAVLIKEKESGCSDQLISKSQHWFLWVDAWLYIQYSSFGLAVFNELGVCDGRIACFHVYCKYTKQIRGENLKFEGV